LVIVIPAQSRNPPERHSHLGIWAPAFSGKTNGASFFHQRTEPLLAWGDFKVIQTDWTALPEPAKAHYQIKIVSWDWFEKHLTK